VVVGSAPALLDPPLSGAAAGATAGADHDKGAAPPGQLATLDPSPTKNIAQKLAGPPPPMYLPVYSDHVDYSDAACMSKSIELLTHAINSKPAELEPPATKIFPFSDTGAPLDFVSKDDETSDDDDMPELEPIPIEPVKSARRIAAQRRIVKRKERKREAKKIYEQEMSAKYTIVANEWFKAKRFAADAQRHDGLERMDKARRARSLIDEVDEFSAGVKRDISLSLEARATRCSRVNKKRKDRAIALKYERTRTKLFNLSNVREPGAVVVRQVNKALAVLRLGSTRISVNFSRQQRAMAVVTKRTEARAASRAAARHRKDKVTQARYDTWRHEAYAHYQETYGFKHFDDPTAEEQVAAVDDECDCVFMVAAPAFASPVWDPRVYLVRPFDGAEGDYDRFVREFLLRMGREYGQSADTYSLAECATGDDEGGPRGAAIANPREANIAADERATRLHSFNLRKRRSANLFAFLLQHIIQPELRTMLEENAKVNGVMVRDGQVAWEKLRLHCYREPNNLTIMAMDKEWNDAGFKSVGLSINTINDMLVYLANLNGARPTASKKMESKIVVKLLSCFDPSTNLGMTAITEHAAPESERKFWRPAVAAAGAAGASPASRDLQGVQLFFVPL